ncbi:hypothetical protein evm_007938 [Chilo suppressalis]|nr:hypothetical protein evm_007938 [Chilo suppressalis]
MLKLQVIYLALCSLSQGAYVSRMATMNRVRAPSAFRPGVTLHRPWTHQQRIMPAASHRVPYVVYRNVPQRYAMKHYGPATTRNVFAAPWKNTARLPLSPGQGFEFIRAASAPAAAHADGGTGAIHTIPAPNLSLSEKPIVVIDSDNFHKHTTEGAKPTYEVTEKYVEQQNMYPNMSPKIEMPVGFSKPSSMSSPDFQSMIKNGPALQFAHDYGLSIALPTPIMPQQFSLQGYNNVPTHQENIINPGIDGIMISPSTLYQADPEFMQKLQAQLIQRFPSLGFIPYAPDAPTISLQPQSEPQIQRPAQNPYYLLENEQITKQTPAFFEPTKNLVQRETHESAVMSLIPQSFSINNVTENQIEVTSASQPQNVTVEVIAAESQPSTTTVKYIVESTTRELPQQNVTPIYYAQIGESIGHAVANSFYSAINDVRAAAALAQVEKPQDQENVTSTTLNPEIKTYYVKQPENQNNVTVELKPMRGVPFSKGTDSVNIAYTLLRSNNKEPKQTKEGAVYAGQIVEATISEDQEFNKEKATLLTRRAPLRIISVTEKKEGPTITTVPPKVTVVKAKIPPKSKLTFDDKTGEPVLRIYASYVDTPLQKELLAAKLNNGHNLNKVKEIVVKKPDTIENWTSAMVKKFDKTQGHDANQVTDFGLKLRSRSDDYMPLFEEYEE